MRLGKLMIFVTDLEEAKRFYGGLPRFELRAEAPDSLLFTLDGAELIIFSCDRKAPVDDYSRVARSVFVFHVDDIEAAMQELGARGVRFLHDQPAEGPFGRYAAFVDPFGNVHEIAEPGAHSS